MTAIHAAQNFAIAMNKKLNAICTIKYMTPMRAIGKP